MSNCRLELRNRIYSILLDMQEAQFEAPVTFMLAGLRTFHERQIAMTCMDSLSWVCQEFEAEYSGLGVPVMEA